MGSKNSIAQWGNTSTHVEKTFILHQNNIFREKHLHARGENDKYAPENTLTEETPPRTWRKPDDWVCINSREGNTSTHVEKT